MSRKVGDEFEAEIATRCNLKLTVNSGAVYDDADLRPKNGKHAIFEAKVKNSVSLPFKSEVNKEITKLEKQALDRFMQWAYFIRCKAGDYVIMDLDSFCMMTREYLKSES